jgi:arylsulfatase A-like enzyme
MKELIGSVDFLFITLDTLRYDVAQQAWETGQLATLSRHIGANGWDKRHTPGSFTYAAHQAFFSGFLPTPLGPGPHPRLFAARFTGSTTTVETTFTFEEATLPEALAARGYHTICIGGTGFFNQQNALARVLPALFAEAYWSPELGVACRHSERNQVARAMTAVHAAGNRRLFLFINIAAIHQPNWFYGATHGPDTLETHAAALLAVDLALKPLLELLRSRGPTFAIVCSDHGTAYGEEGYFGHRIGHDVVWTVPYAHFIL